MNGRAERTGSLYEGEDYGLAGLGPALTPVLDQGNSGGDCPQDTGGVSSWHGGTLSQGKCDGS
jgi:hypothetical protein